jgi:hypothetical protein
MPVAQEMSTKKPNNRSRNAHFLFKTSNVKKGNYRKSIKNTSKMSTEFAGILPTFLLPYANPDGINNLPFPPFLNLGMPSVQPSITPFRLKVKG